jgi:general secretion pathway protein K
LTLRSEPGRGRAGERGIALLLVLWIFMILGVLALDFAQYIRDDAMAAVNLADETRGYYLALAGMNQAIYEAERVREEGPGVGGEELGEEEERQVPPDGRWHEGTFAGGRWAVCMSDEGGRVPLNVADEILLTRLITNLATGGNATTGLDQRDTEAIAVVVDSLVDWRDPDDLPRLHGAESDYYLGLPEPYLAKNGWFDAPEELLLVRGITPELFYGQEGMPGLRDLVSVHNRHGTINVRTAPPAVLQILLGLDPAAAADLVAQREEDPAGVLAQLQGQATAIDPILARRLVDDDPTIVLIEARADLADPRNQSRVAAVADLSAELADGARILRWFDRVPWGTSLCPGEPGGVEEAA